jgi:hypothetical protein
LSDDTLIEIRDLLVEIRDLLLPVADANMDAYRIRLAEREAGRVESIRALVSSSDKRIKAWKLADGTLTQTEISNKSGMVKSGVSTFFKDLRTLGAIVDDPNPKRTLEV